MSTICAMLDRDAVHRRKGIRLPDAIQGGPSPQYPGVGTIWEPAGEARVSLASLVGSLPVELDLETVKEFSIWDSFGLSPKRRNGMYRLGAAEGVLDTETAGSIDKPSRQYKIQIRSKKWEDAVELYRRIRAGTINPTNGDDWEAPQVPTILAVRAAHDLGDIWRCLIRAFREGLAGEAK